MVVYHIDTLPKDVKIVRTSNVYERIIIGECKGERCVIKLNQRVVKTINSGNLRKCVVIAPNKKETHYSSLSDAGLALEVSTTTILNHINKGKITKGRLKGYEILDSKKSEG